MMNMPGIPMLVLAMAITGAFAAPYSLHGHSSVNAAGSRNIESVHDPSLGNSAQPNPQTVLFTLDKGTTVEIGLHVDVQSTVYPLATLDKRFEFHPMDINAIACKDSELLTWGTGDDSPFRSDCDALAQSYTSNPHEDWGWFEITTSDILSSPFSNGIVPLARHESCLFAIQVFTDDTEQMDEIKGHAIMVGTQDVSKRVQEVVNLAEGDKVQGEGSWTCNAYEEPIHHLYPTIKWKTMLWTEDIGDIHAPVVRKYIPITKPNGADSSDTPNIIQLGNIEESVRRIDVSHDGLTTEYPRAADGDHPFSLATRTKVDYLGKNPPSTCELASGSDYEVSPVPATSGATTEHCHILQVYHEKTPARYTIYLADFKKHDWVPITSYGTCHFGVKINLDALGNKLEGGVFIGNQDIESRLKETVKKAEEARLGDGEGNGFEVASHWMCYIHDVGLKGKMSWIVGRDVRVSA